MSNEYISHSGKGHDDNPPGPGSGRYRWGSGNRPFQRSSLATRIRQRRERKRLDQATKHIDRNREAMRSLKQTDPVKYARLKAAAINSGTAEQLMLFQGDLNMQEARRALDRINMEIEISQAARRQSDERWKTVTSTGEKIVNIDNYFKSATNIVANMDRLYNIAKNNPAQRTMEQNRLNRDIAYTKRYMQDITNPNIDLSKFATPNSSGGGSGGKNDKKGKKK